MMKKEEKLERQLLVKRLIYCTHENYKWKKCDVFKILYLLFISAAGLLFSGYM